MARYKDTNWQLSDSVTDGHATIAVLMDIRDELKALRTAVQPLRHFDCGNFLDIPLKLDKIVVNTRKKRKRAVK